MAGQPELNPFPIKMATRHGKLFYTGENRHLELMNDNASQDQGLPPKE